MDESKPRIADLRDLGVSVEEDGPAFADLADRYRVLVEHSPDGICVHQDGRLVYANTTGMRLLGADSVDQIVGHPISEFVHPDSIPPLLQRIESLDRQGAVSDPSEMILRRFDGGTVDVEAVSVRTRWAERPAYQAILRDLTAQKATEAALRRAEQHFRTVVTSLEEGVIVVGCSGRVESINPAARRILRLDAGETPITAIDFPICDTDGNAIPRMQHPIAQTLRTGTTQLGYVFGVTIGIDRRVWLSGSCSRLSPDDPNSAVVISFTDITEQRAVTQQLEYAATHDSLTELPNRHQIVSRLAEMLGSTGPAQQLAVLFLDLDDFKVINDSLGHDTGDTVLSIVGQRLRRAVREGDTVGRLGGDEFVAVLSEHAAAVDAIIDRLHRILAEPLHVGGRTLHLSASIGIVTLDSTDPRAADDVLRDADIAMYEAKTSGPGHSTHFTVELRHRMHQRLDHQTRRKPLFDGRRGC